MITSDKIVAVTVGAFGCIGTVCGLLGLKKVKELRKINSALVEENLSIQSEYDALKELTEKASLDGDKNLT